MTRDSLDCADLHLQASDLCKQLEIPARAGYFVPKIGSAPAKALVQSWKEAVTVISTEHTSKDFQDAIAKQIDQASDGVTTQVYSTADKIMKTVVGISKTEADFKSASFEQDIEEKTAAVDRAQTRINDAQSEVTGKMRAFDASLKKYEEDQKQKAKEDEIFMWLEIAVDVGLCLFEGPGPLISGAGKLSKAAKRTKNIQSAIKKTQRLKNIGELCGKFQKVHEVKGVVKDFYQAWKNPKAKNAAEPDDIKGRLKICMQEARGTDGFDWG